MNNLDPVIINYKNLMPEDKRIIQAHLAVLKIITKQKDEYKESMKSKLDLERDIYSVAVEVIEEAEVEIRNMIITKMSEMIDGYDHLVEDQDTDDYFYGLESDDNE